MKRAVLLLLLLGACKKEPELGGVDKWHVDRTKLSDATGRCMPEDLGDGRQGAYCFGQRAIGIGGMPVDLDLFFDGTEPDARLVEIQMKIGGCQPEGIETWMRKNFGAVTDQKANRVAWKNSKVIALGYLPLADEPGRCLVRILPVREQARFDMLWNR